MGQGGIELAAPGSAVDMYLQSDTLPTVLRSAAHLRQVLLQFYL